MITVGLGLPCQEIQTQQHQPTAQHRLCASSTSQMKLEKAGLSCIKSHTNDFRHIILHIRELHVFHIPIICCRLWRDHLAASSCWRPGVVLLPHPLERGLGACWRWSIHAGRRDRRLLGIGKGCFQLVQLFLQIAHSVSKCFIGLRKEGHWTGDLSCLSHFLKEAKHSLRKPIPNPWTLQW